MIHHIMYKFEIHLNLNVTLIKWFIDRLTHLTD